MPIYEYECQDCGHRLDALQKISDEPLVECPSCSEASLKRLISAPQFRLKGGGWYETDFKTGTKRNLVDGKDPASKKDASDSAAKKDTASDSGGTKKTGGAKDAGGAPA